MVTDTVNIVTHVTMNIRSFDKAKARTAKDLEAQLIVAKDQYLE